jgi:hypothetical protein
VMKKRFSGRGATFVPRPARRAAQRSRPGR